MSHPILPISHRRILYTDEKRLKVGKKETKNPNPAFGKRSKNFN